MPILTVFDIGAVAWKPSHDSGCTCKVLDMSHLDLYETALSKVELDARAFCPLEPYRDVVNFAFPCLLRLIAVEAVV